MVSSVLGCRLMVVLLLSCGCKVHAVVTQLTAVDCSLSLLHPIQPLWCVLDCAVIRKMCCTH